MERSTAIEIAGHLKALDGPINAAMAAVEKIQDIGQRRAFRLALADVVGAVYTELFVRSERSFPISFQTRTIPMQNSRRPLRPAVTIPILDPKWVSYTGLHGEGLKKSSSDRIRANTRKWESGAPPAS